MRVIIAGSRSVTDFASVYNAVQNCGFNPTLIISGCAKGVDQLGEQYAIMMNIPIQRFPADWDTWGKGAGFRRNIEMAKHADALIAIWDGKSNGTKHMIQTANNCGLLVYRHRV